MSNREKAEESIKTGKGFNMEIIEKCVTCSRVEIGEIMLLQIPSGILMCLKCCDKYPDDNTKMGPMHGGRMPYKIGYGVLDNRGNVI